MGHRVIQVPYCNKQGVLHLLGVRLNGWLRPGAGYVIKQSDSIEESLSNETCSLLKEVGVPVHADTLFSCELHTESDSNYSLNTIGEIGTPGGSESRSVRDSSMLNRVGDEVEGGRRDSHGEMVIHLQQAAKLLNGSDSRAGKVACRIDNLRLNDVVRDRVDRKSRYECLSPSPVVGGEVVRSH